MSLSQPKMVLFDLDGTLADTAPDLACAIDYMQEQLGLPKRGEAKVRRWIGNGIEKLVKRALSDDFDGEPETALYEKGFVLFKEFYAANACVKSQVYPGVMTAIDYLKTKDCKIGCVTNKRDVYTVKVLKTLGLYDEFGIVISGDTLSQKKPDPLPLLHAAEFFQVEAKHGLMIGDSVTDIKAAANAGMPMLYVSYGYNQGKDIRHLPVDAIVQSLSELPSLLEK